jgi:hypothetical protein
MFRKAPFETRQPGMPSFGRPIAWLVAISVFAQISPALAQFREMVNRLPKSANAVVLLNMEKAKQSPMGVREGWTKKVEKGFESGLIRVPPQAARFVLASQIDLEFMEPVWSAAVVDLSGELSLEQFAKRRGGTLDTLDKAPAVALPNDTYVVQFGPQVLGAMGPGNRQSVLRWIREAQGGGKTELSPYLQKAAGYSDKAQTEIIMAIDLDGALSWERIGKYLDSKKELLKLAAPDLKKATDVLSGIQGLRLGIRLGDRPYGMLTVDFREDTSPVGAIAKPLLLQVLADGGLQIDDLEEWKSEASGTTVSLSGYLTTSGLRRVLAIVESPTSSESVAKESKTPPSPGELEANRAKASLDHFHAVTGMFDDLKKDMRSSKNLASTAMWFDKYAKRIEKLPILNVDEDLLKYSGFVASTMRQAAGSGRTMGIQSGVRQSQIISSSAGHGYAGYSYGRYGWHGGYGASGVVPIYDPVAEAKGVYAERRVVRAEEKAKAATDIHGLRDQVVAATADIRRAMTQRYQTEF